VDTAIILTINYKIRGNGDFTVQEFIHEIMRSCLIKGLDDKDVLYPSVMLNQVAALCISQDLTLNSLNYQNLRRSISKDLINT